MLTSLEIATIGIEPWFVPVVAVLLLIGLWGFWQSSRVHGMIWPFVVATISSATVVAARFAEMPLVLWGATAALSLAYVSDWLIKKKIARV